MYICNMKKNTLLYLDTNIVTKAKQCKLNISQITEEAIKSRLFPMLSYGARAEMDFWEYLKELEKEKCVFFLPVRIKGAKLINVGPIKNITLDFSKFNIIFGNNGMGKTTSIRSIAHIFGHHISEDNFSDKAIIELDVHPEKKYKIDLSVDNKKSIRCILVDDGGSRFDKEHYQKFFDYLKKLDMQVIMTNHSLREHTPYGKINIIKIEKKHWKK